MAVAMVGSARCKTYMYWAGLSRAEFLFSPGSEGYLYYMSEHSKMEQRTKDCANARELKEEERAWSNAVLYVLTFFLLGEVVRGAWLVPAYRPDEGRG